MVNTINKQCFPNTSAVQPVAARGTITGSAKLCAYSVWLTAVTRAVQPPAAAAEKTGEVVVTLPLLLVATLKGAGGLPATLQVPRTCTPLTAAPASSTARTVTLHVMLLPVAPERAATAGSTATDMRSRWHGAAPGVRHTAPAAHCACEQQLACGMHVPLHSLVPNGHVHALRAHVAPPPQSLLLQHAASAMQAAPQGLVPAGHAQMPAVHDLPMEHSVPVKAWGWWGTRSRQAGRQAGRQ
jgi:hypothetical protein